MPYPCLLFRCRGQALDVHSHHSFIILLITSTSSLLTGLYLISTYLEQFLPGTGTFALSFIILLVTSTSALLTGLYLISTEVFKLADYEQQEDVNALSGLYFISTLESIAVDELRHQCVNALSG